MRKLVILALFFCSMSNAQIDSWAYCEYLQANLETYYHFDLYIFSVTDDISTFDFAQGASIYANDSSYYFEPFQTRTVIGFIAADKVTVEVAIVATTLQSNIMCIFKFDESEKL